MANFKPLSIRFCATIPVDVSETETCLQLGPAATAKICDTLGTECYTRLFVDVGPVTEQVQVSCDANGLIKMVRDSKGSACSWPAGSLMYFDWSAENMSDWIACNQPVVDDDECPIKIPGHTGTWDAETQKWCYVPDDPDGTNGKSWIYKGTKFTIENGVIKCEETVEGNFPDGTYQNATIVVENGCVTSYAKGCNIIAQACAPMCGCDKCTGETGEGN